MPSQKAQPSLTDGLSQDAWLHYLCFFQREKKVEIDCSEKGMRSISHVDIVASCPVKKIGGFSNNTNGQ